MLVFVGGRKTLEPREKPSELNENQQQSDQPTYDAVSRIIWNPDHIGGRPALSPLQPPCSPDTVVHYYMMYIYVT